MDREAFHIINTEMSFSNVSFTRITHVIESERLLIQCLLGRVCDLSVHKLAVRGIKDLHVVNHEALWGTFGTCLCLED